MAKSSSYRHYGYGILNPDGKVWTPRHFETEGAARAHLEGFWSRNNTHLMGFRIVPIRVTITPVAPTNRSEGGRDG